MPQDETLFTVSRRIQHHDIHSGYDQLSRYIGKPLRPPEWLYRLRGTGLLHHYLRKKSGMEWYDGLYAELFTFLHMRRSESCIYHFLIAERDFRYIPALMPDRGHKIICTFHATPGEFQRIMKYKEHLKSIDAAIIVSKNQASLLEPVVGKEKVFFVPHGVDVEYFVPGPTPRASSKVCVCVGHHHRDLETLAKVASIIRKQDSDVRFIVVDRVFDVYLTLEQRRRFRELFAGAGNIELRTDLTGEELLRLYQTSDLMVLPLFDATANVAVLEAISCGLPLIVTDSGGITDYVDQNCAAFAAVRDAQTMANHVMRLLRDPHECEKLSKASRTKALEFDWRIIADRMKDVYKKVAGK